MPLGEICTRAKTYDPRRQPATEFTYIDISSIDSTLKRIVEPKRILGADAPSRARQLVRTGDILVSTTRPNLNAVALITEEFDGAVCSTGFCVLRPGSALVPPYLFAFVQSAGFVETLSDLVKGALYPAVTDGQVLSQMIPLPPLPEQKRIAALLTEQLAAVDHARAATQVQLDAARALPAAYLRDVFSSVAAQGWPKKTLGEISALVQNGIYKPAEFYGRGWPFIRMYNIQNDSWTLVLDRMAQVELDQKEYETYRLAEGDLLFSRVNSYELVGKCAYVSSDAVDHVFENMIIRVRLQPGTKSLFIAQQLSTSENRARLQAIAKKAIGQASINSGDLRSIAVCIPPVQVQEEISRTVDAQIRSTATLSASLASKLDTINQLPAALLRRAFSGGL